MNTKGMTLLEMIVALSILAIGSLMLFTGFMSVSSVLSRANEQKNASDILLSYAEKSKDEEITNQVLSTSNTTSYTIKNKENAVAKGDIKINEMRVKEQDTLPLRMISETQFGIVKDQVEYIKACSDAQRYYNAINALVASSDPKNLYTNFPNVIFYDPYHEQWDVFASTLLPKKMQDAVGIADKYNIVGAFPWDYYNGNGKKAHHGGLLIYLSFRYKGEKPAITEETIHVVYDYIDQKWYYFEGDGYVVSYNETDDSEPSFYHPGKPKKIKTFEELRAIMKSPNDGWKVLDEQSEYRLDNPDASWKGMN